MSLYNQFATDKSAEKDGVILDYGLNSKDQPVQIRIARAGGANVRFAKSLQHKLAPHKRVLDSMDNKVAEKLLIEVYADTVVLGWEGVEDKQGNELPYSRENVIKLFTDLPDLFADVQQQSQKLGLFREELRQEEAGNSQRS